uniref:Uncharacterized protein n=1 Tax=Chenopodium quinoa TaxID=63459 RepID=A0A803KTW8_CHEQI
MMYVCSTFLAPVANKVIDYKIIKYCENVKEIPNLDWCSYVLENLCNIVQRLKNNKNKEARSGISGCILVLQIAYFHHIAFRGHPEPTELPLIKHWTDEKIKTRISKEAKASFGQGELQKEIYPVCAKEGRYEVNIADDGDGIHEEPNEDLNNVVSSVTESILKDTVAATKDNGDNGDADKQPIAEEIIVLKNIHQEIASKINITVDCELYQVVADYCFVKYNAFKQIELVKYEAPLMIIRDDTRPLELALMSQYPSQLTPKTDEKEIPSPSTHAAELNQACLVVVKLLKETIQYLDNKEYDDRDRPFYKILASLVVEEMSNFLKRINHEIADEILVYESDEVKFK